MKKQEQIQWLIDNIEKIDIRGIGEISEAGEPILCIEIDCSWDEVNNSPLEQKLGIIKELE